MAKPSTPSSHLLEEVAEFRLPRATQRRFDRLMTLNNEGDLTPDQSQELKALVELTERIAILKGRALLVLGRKNG